MVREHEVHTSTVDVEMIAKVLATHRRTFTVPTREAIAPRTWPAHDMLRLSFLPKGEIHLIALLVRSVECTRIIDDIIQVAPRKNAIVMVAVVLLHIEIHRALAFVGIAILQDFLHQLNLLDDVSRGMRFYTWRKHIQRIHCLMVAVRVILSHFHWFQLFESCLLSNLVLALIRIVFQVSHIGDVAHIAHLVTEVLKIAENDVEGDGRTRMTQVGIAINGWTTNVHAHERSMKRFEWLLGATQTIVNIELIVHE